MPQDPPGFSEGEIDALRAKLPGGRGMLRVARYYQTGTTKTVVYEVLDEHENRLVDKKNRLWDMHVEYPPRLAEQPAGTLFRIG